MGAARTYVRPHAPPHHPQHGHHRSPASCLIPLTWADERAPAHHGGTTGGSRELAAEIARARVALAPFATDLGRAKARGYKLQITPMMPDMGYHFLNPDVEGFDVRRPPILVYVRRGRNAQLVAAEWVFTEQAGQAAAAGRALWLLRCRLPLRGRDVHAPEQRGGLREDQP